MNHHLDIDLYPKKARPPLVKMETRNIGLRLWHRLFGHNRVVILFPGDTIEAVTIKEQPEPKDDAPRNLTA